jgi:mediator complex subunit MED14
MLCRDDRDGRDVGDSLVPIHRISSRVVAVSVKLTTLSIFSLPGMSDSARKRKLADFVVAWKKQVVKLYAVTKWSRDADIVQKCMVCRPLPSMEAPLTTTDEEYYGFFNEPKPPVRGCHSRANKCQG